MKSSNGGRADRVTRRAVKTMGRAQKSWTKAEAIRKFDKSKTSQNFAGDEFGTNASSKANQLYKRAGRQEAKAKRQMEKANYLKASKAVPQSKLALKKGLKEAGEEVGSMASSAAAASMARKKMAVDQARLNKKWGSKKVTKK